MGPRMRMNEIIAKVPSVLTASRHTKSEEISTEIDGHRLVLYVVVYEWDAKCPRHCSAHTQCEQSHEDDSERSEVRRFVVTFIVLNVVVY
jgi:hypothetical protein